MTKARVTRATMTPLLGHTKAKRALELFASGRINALELRDRLAKVARTTGTSTDLVREFAYRAACAKFGIEAGGL